MFCPLCSSTESVLFDQDKFRSFYQCRHCSLVFVPRNELISASDEKARYETHKNDEGDPAYHAYLSKIAEAVSRNLTPGMKGLDFGSGRTKLLARLISDDVDSYDVFFHPHEALKQKTYDFIIMSEVIEHLRDLSDELQVINKMLRSDGLLFVKTKLLPENNFSSWFYKRDITHVQFFSEASFKFLSEKYGFSTGEKIGEDLFMFRNHR